MSTLPNAFLSNAGSVADGNLNQGVKAWLSLGDVLRETPISVKQ
jgi:hypothetical protein